MPELRSTGEEVDQTSPSPPVRRPFLNITGSPRIDRAMFCMTILGGVISLLIGYAEFGFLDFWLGAAIGSPIGLMWGITLEERDRSSTFKNWPRVWGILLLVSAIAIVGGAQIIFTVATAKANVENLATLKSGQILRIDFRRLNGGNSFASIHEPVALEEFSVAARDAIISFPGSVGADESFQEWSVKVVLSDGNTIAFQWSHRGKCPATMDGMFLNPDSTTIINKGEFSSTTLRAWFRKYVKPRL
jgi:hypothetical protein